MALRKLEKDPDALRELREAAGIGERYGVSRERIRQLEAEGLEQLRDVLGVEDRGR